MRLPLKAEVGCVLRTIHLKPLIRVKGCNYVSILIFHDRIMGQEFDIVIMAEVEKELWVENRLGLHARPVAKIATAAQQFEAEITLEKDGQVVNARDLLDVLALDCPQGTRLVLRARGPQAREAAANIVSLFARKFGES